MAKMKCTHTPIPNNVRIFIFEPPPTSTHGEYNKFHLSDRMTNLGPHSDKNKSSRASRHSILAAPRPTSGTCIDLNEYTTFPKTHTHTHCWQAISSALGFTNMYSPLRACLLNTSATLTRSTPCPAYSSGPASLSTSPNPFSHILR